MHDSGDVEGAGVLLRQFDKNNALKEPWLPCPQEGPDSWCAKFSDRWSALMMNALVPHLYDNNGGVVLAPTARLFCACEELLSCTLSARTLLHRPDSSLSLFILRVMLPSPSLHRLASPHAPPPFSPCADGLPIPRPRGW